MTARELKAAVRPLDFYRAEIPTMPAPKISRAWTDGGLCPFHEDRRRGSFWINLETGAFHCFACGASGGDILAFAQQRHELTFPEAMQAIADAWGLSA
ncbi:MAG: hypothetical protein GC168_05130 [Candidatus Hydrogenedens sp.]|nr:hypothetical protein [Candidatus Hydrogenedens sp.]